MDSYSDGVVKEKLDNHEKRLESHHRSIGRLEVGLSDAQAALEVGKESRIRIQSEITNAKETAATAKIAAEKAAGAVSERFDKLATSFRNWTLFIVTVAGIVIGVVKGLGG
jgi:chromosome segregation ATPase